MRPLPPLLQWLAWILTLCPPRAAAGVHVRAKVCAAFTDGGFPDDCCTDAAVGLAFGKLAWEQQYVPAAGGAPRVNITYDYVDTGGDPGKAITCAFTGWHQESAALILGASWSVLSVPMAQLGATIGGAQLDYGGTSDALSSPSYPMYVRTCVPDSALAAGMAQLLTLPTLYNYSRLGILYEPDDWGSGLQTRMLQELQHIRPGAYLKQVPLLDGGDRPGLRERLRTFKGSTWRVFVVLAQRTGSWEVLAEAEFQKYITGPAFFLFGPADVDGGLAVLGTLVRQRFMGLQEMGPGRAATDSGLRAGWEQLWLGLRLADLPEPVATWASCLGGPLSAKPDCIWGGQAMFQDTRLLDGDYFGYAFDASWLFHSAVQRLVDRNIAAPLIHGGLLIDELINSSGSAIGLGGPIVLTSSGDRVLVTYKLMFLDETGAQAVFGSYDATSQMFSMTRLPMFADGSTVRPEDTFAPCPQGHFRDDASCEPAPPGSFCPQGTLTQPIPCAPGSASASSGQAQCALCDAGRYSNAFGRTACSECRPGRYAERAGQWGCLQCMVGYYANASGQAGCDVCLRGEYADAPGSVACTACPALMSTCDVASRSLEQCECVEGHFRDGAGCSVPPTGVVCSFGSDKVADCQCDVGHFGVLGRCQACTPGMVCESVGLRVPMQAAGYSLQLAGGDPGAGTAAFSAYRCYDELQCPGGPAGTCAPGRTDLACGRCLDGYYALRDGSCARCTAADRTAMAILGAVCLLAVFPLYWYACPDVTRRSINALTVTNVAGQIIFAVQALGVFADLRVRWAEPVASVMRTMRLVQLDFQGLKVQCTLGDDDSAKVFVGEMLLYPAFLSYLALVASVLHITRLYAFTWKRYINVAGLVALVLHIPLTLAVMRPFYCIANPNGTQHVLVHPDILCWRSQAHRVLVALGVLGILAYPVANITVVTSITCGYAKLLSTDGGLRLLEKYQFLFQRFTPHCYYYALAYFWRGMLLPIIPVLWPESGIGQVISVMFLLEVCLCLVVRLQPWASPLGNITETSILAGVVFVVHISAFLVDNAHGSIKELGILLLLAIAAMVLVAIAVIFMCFYRRLAHATEYVAFLCHHKPEAGVLARFFKIRLRDITNRDIFLDADNLQELAVLFDIVRTRIQTMVGLMTKYTLERMWCAGELTTAVRNQVPMVLVECEDYAPLGDEQLAAFGAHWSQEQRATLATAGLPLEAIREAYRHIAGLSAGAVRLDRFGSREAHAEAIRAVAHRCGLASSRTSEVIRRSSLPGGVLQQSRAVPVAPVEVTTDVIVAACKTQAESRCVAYILSERLQAGLRVPVRPAFCREEARPMARSARYLLVVLTNGLLESTPFVELLLCVHADIDLVTVLADTSFQFPGGNYFLELETVHGSKGPEVEARIRRVVNRLALPYSALGSEAVLNTQVAELLSRFKPRGQLDSTPAPSPVASRSGSADWAAAHEPSEESATNERPAAPDESATPSEVEVRVQAAPGHADIVSLN